MPHARGPSERVEDSQELDRLWELNGPAGCALGLTLVVLATELVSSARVVVIPSDSLKLLPISEPISVLLLKSINGFQLFFSIYNNINITNNNNQKSLKPTCPALCEEPYLCHLV